MPPQESVKEQRSRRHQREIRYLAAGNESSLQRQLAESNDFGCELLRNSRPGSTGASAPPDAYEWPNFTAALRAVVRWVGESGRGEGKSCRAVGRPSWPENEGWNGVSMIFPGLEPHSRRGGRYQNETKIIWKNNTTYG